MFKEYKIIELIDKTKLNLQNPNSSLILNRIGSTPQASKIKIIIKSPKK